MNEREKMLKGLLYDANYDKELLAERKRAKHLCHAYNQCDPLQEEQKNVILKELLPHAKENLCIEAPFYCDYGSLLYIGHDVFINHNCVFLDGGTITLGNHVFIAPGCGFHTAYHPIHVQQRINGLEYAAPITIADHVWIGAGVQVLPGVTVGENSIIGAGSVVCKDIPANVVAAGVPCRILRELSEKEKELNVSVADLK